jgi:hypothetical protein
MMEEKNIQAMKKAGVISLEKATSEDEKATLRTMIRTLNTVLELDMDADIPVENDNGRERDTDIDAMKHLETERELALGQDPPEECYSEDDGQPTEEQEWRDVEGEDLPTEE